MTAPRVLPSMSVAQWRKEEKAAKRLKLEDTLAFQIRGARLPEPYRQFHFAKTIGRQWAADFAWPDRMLIAEVDGGSWMKISGHTSGTGFERDCERGNEALLLGWSMLHLTGAMINDGRALGYLERALANPRNAA
jgi:very-short-patch-repair endonuclease